MRLGLWVAGVKKSYELMRPEEPQESKGKSCKETMQVRVSHTPAGGGELGGMNLRAFQYLDRTCSAKGQIVTMGTDDGLVSSSVLADTGSGIQSRVFESPYPCRALSPPQNSHSSPGSDVHVEYGRPGSNVREVHVYGQTTHPSRAAEFEP